MKGIVSVFMIFTLIFIPVLAFSTPAQEQEINSLNKLPGSKALLNLSGGRCWQTCADDDYGHLNCVTTCDDTPGQAPSGGGEVSIEGLLLLTLVTAGIVVIVYYIANQPS
jgi:hypothetical protein